MMELRKINPAKNMHRFYRLAIEPTLFGDFALVREWGRIDAKNGHIKEDWHSTRRAADLSFSKALKRRISGEYFL